MGRSQSNQRQSLTLKSGQTATPPAADVDSPSCSPTDVVYHELGSICCTRSRPARKRIAGVALRLGMTRTVAAHVTHRAVAYLPPARRRLVSGVAQLVARRRPAFRLVDLACATGVSPVSVLTASAAAVALWSSG